MTSGTRGRILQFRLWGNERSVHDVTPRIGGTNLLSDASSFHTAIFDALCACLNLSASDGIKLIHEAYAEPENTPRPARNKNVIYWTVLQDPTADPVSTTWNAASGTAGSHVPVVYTTLQYQLIIVCYGPACEAYASRIRHMLFLDGRGFPRQILRAAGIYPIPDPPSGRTAMTTSPTPTVPRTRPCRCSAR